ncbi:hypothetical protein [Trueperella pyogenes]
MSEDYFIYLDETGVPDFESPKTPDDFPYFGVGSATYIGDHSQENWDAQVLRLALEERGLSVEKAVPCQKRRVANTQRSVFPHRYAGTPI